MDSTKASEEVMRAPQDPYAGITLPKPPAGYRLAKWGEDVPERSLWWDGDEQGCGEWNADWKRGNWPWRSWESTHNCVAIFATPLDQPSLPKSWQFRHDPGVPKQPKTLADVPEGVASICSASGELCVMQRFGVESHGVKEGGDSFGKWGRPPSLFKFVRYLDPVPQKPTTLSDVPDGRVVQVAGGRCLWRFDGNLYCLLRDGLIFRETVTPAEFTITDYIAEFRGPA